MASVNSNIMTYADALRSEKTVRSVTVFSNYILKNGNKAAIQSFAEKVANSITEMVNEAPPSAEIDLVTELLDSLAPNPGDRVESLGVTPKFGIKAARSNKLIAQVCGGFTAIQYDAGETYNIAATTEMMRKDLLETGITMPIEVASAAGVISDLDERSDIQPSEVASRVILTMAKSIHDNKGAPRTLTLSDLSRKIKVGGSVPVTGGSKYSLSNPADLAPGEFSEGLLLAKPKRIASSTNRIEPQITKINLDILEKGVSLLHKYAKSGVNDSDNFRTLVKEVVGSSVDSATMLAWANALSNHLEKSNKIYTKMNKLGDWLDTQGALMDFTTVSSATLTAQSLIDKITKELTDEGNFEKTLLMLTKVPPSEAIRVLYAADIELHARLSLIHVDDREFSNDQATLNAVGLIIDHLLSKKAGEHSKPSKNIVSKAKRKDKLADNERTINNKLGKLSLGNSNSKADGKRKKSGKRNDIYDDDDNNDDENDDDDNNDDNNDAESSEDGSSNSSDENSDDSSSSRSSSGSSISNTSSINRSIKSGSSFNSSSDKKLINLNIKPAGKGTANQALLLMRQNATAGLIDGHDGNDAPFSFSEFTDRYFSEEGAPSGRCFTLCDGHVCGSLVMMTKSTASNAGLLNKGTHMSVLQGPDCGPHITIDIKTQLSGLFASSPDELVVFSKQHKVLMLNETKGFPHCVTVKYANKKNDFIDRLVKFTLDSFEIATRNDYIGHPEWASIWALHMYFFAHIYIQFAQHRKFYSLKELILQWETHFKPFLEPTNTSFTLTDVESRNLVDIPYEFTFIMLSLGNNCACRWPRPLCICNTLAENKAKTTSSQAPVVATSVMFAALNWVTIPCRWTENFANFRDKHKAANTGKASVASITDAYVATGKPKEAVLSEKLSPYGLEFVTREYVKTITGKPVAISSKNSSTSRLDSHALMRVMGNQAGLIPAMYWLFKPRAARGERKATSMKPLISEAMLKALAINKNTV